MEIINAGDLRRYLEDLVKECDRDQVRTLNEYLCALLGAIEQYKDTKPTYAIFGELMKKGFDVVPLPFQLSWKMQKELPYIHYEPNPDDFDNTLIHPQTKETVSKFEVLEKTLIYQIAELKRMEEDDEETISENDEKTISENDEELDPMKEIEESHWVNFDVVSYLNASMFGLENNELDTECDWLTFTDLIEYGRTVGIDYE